MKEHEQENALHDNQLNRRQLLLGAAAGTVGAVASTHATAATMTDDASDGVAINLDKHYEFYGDHGQVGIATPQQRHCVYMTFDLSSSSPRALQVLLARWSASIAQMMQGKPIGQVEPNRPNGIGGDTGEAFDLEPASLTVTVGLGPKIFSEEFGFADKKPALLRELVRLPSDALRPEFSGGDLSIQACADDQQVAYHAVRNLARIAKLTGAASTRWTTQGFFRTTAGPKKVTPRNLLGFRDGTRNIHTPEDFDRYVWIHDDGPAWQQNGTYQIVRKIKMHIESWDTDRVSDQNDIFGRFKTSGAPLSGKHEFDTPDFKMKNENGDYTIPETSHIRLASRENNHGVQILRRPFNYSEGINDVGLLEAGLLFLCYQNDPAHFEMLQSKLGASDALNEYITHIGSAIFYVPPAPKKGHYIAEELFS